MPISGLVVTLSDQPDRREQAINAIAAEPRLEIGPSMSHQMALVMDTKSSEEDKAVWNWLRNLAGVVFVDVAMVGFDEASDDAETPRFGILNQPTRTTHGC